VTYLNGSKVLTSGSALTFDGAKLGVGVASAQAGIDISNSGSWTSGNIYNYPAGNAFVKAQGAASQNNWIGIAGDYGVTTGSANLLLQANFNNTNQQAGHYIGSEAQSATSSHLTFGSLTGGATTGTNATKNEQMRIDSAGNVGIGTSSPTYKLSVNGVGNFYSGVAGLGRVFLGDPADNTGYIGLYRSAPGPSNSNTAGNALNFASIDGHTFSTGLAAFGLQTERMRIDSAGNVGIGTSSPQTLLNAYSSGAAIVSADSDTQAAFRATRHTNDAAGSQILIRKSRGTLASPTAINSADQAGQIIFQGFGGTNYRALAQIIGFCETYVADDNISGVLSFNTRPAGAGTLPAERMRIDSAGNVGIGTSSPSTKLDVAGTASMTSYKEGVFAITDGTTVNLDPNNGSIQTWTLGDNRTPGQANWAAGQSITLMIDDGTARTITWTTLGVVWETNGGSAPTLATSGFTVITLWKVGTTIYGARVGDA
jgi:hypothetical protein